MSSLNFSVKKSQWANSGINALFRCSNAITKACETAIKITRHSRVPSLITFTLVDIEYLTKKGNKETEQMISSCFVFRRNRLSP